MKRAISASRSFLRNGRTTTPWRSSTWSASFQMTGLTLSRPVMCSSHISRSIALAMPGALEQRRVVAVRPRREDQRRALVALEQHAALVVGGEVGRPDHAVAALPAQPLLGAVEQRRRRLRVLLALEEAEPAPAVLLEALEVVVDLRRDPPDRAPVAQRQEVLGAAVLEERVLAPVEELLALEEQRRDPVAARRGRAGTAAG